MNSEWRHVVWETLLFLVILASPLIYAFGRDFPYIYEDEFGVLGAAAVLAGRDWSAPAMPYYGFLLSVFTFPFQLLDLTPALTYRLTLATNAFFLAGSALLSFKLMRLLKLSVAPFPAALVILAAYTYPAAVYFSSLALGESILLFLVTAIAWALVRLMVRTGITSQMLSAMMAGIFTGAVPFAHSRGVAFLLAGLSVLLCAVFLKKVSIRLLCLVLGCMSVAYISLAQIRGYLLSHFYTEILSSTDSVEGILAVWAQNLSTTSAVIELGRVVAGQAYYLTSTTYGMWFLGLILLLVFQVRFWASEYRYRNDLFGVGVVNTDFALLSLYILLGLALVYTASVLQMSAPSRTDHYFYGRYNEILVPGILTLVLVSVYWLDKWHLKLWIAAGILCVVVMGLIVSTYPDSIFNKETIYAQITGWFIHRHGVWKVDPTGVMFSVLACQIILGFLLLKSRNLFLLVLISVNSYTSYYLFTNRHVEIDRYWQDFVTLQKNLDGVFDGATIGVVGGRHNRPYALQFALPKSIIVYDKWDSGSVDAILDYTGHACLPELVVATVQGDGHLCYSRAQP